MNFFFEFIYTLYDIVLVAPSKQALKKILNKVHEWAIKNEMTFGINKCSILIVKLIKFVKTDKL